MTTENVMTITKIMESLPENQQEQVIEHLREYILDLQDEIRWQQSFKNSEQQLIKAAQIAKQQIANGQAEMMDYEKL